MEVYDSAECWDRTRIKHSQIVHLRDIIRLASHTPFYAERFKQFGVVPEFINSLEDFKRVPFTTKDDLRSQYPHGLACVPYANFVRMHCSSGTTGSPIAICYTKEDIDIWASLMARSMFVTGIRSYDVFQNMSGYGMFTGGLGIHYGAEKLGCLTIPAGAGNSKRQIKLIKDFGTTAVHILPSYALHIGSMLQEMGEDPKKLSLRIALVGAEPYTEQTRRRIESMFNINVYNSYGLSEMNGPGVGIECAFKQGMHIWEDAYLFEIIDPETGEEKPDGEFGELVITTLRRRGMPILRYRTRDLTRVIPGDCPCGRKHRRIDRITGRSDDMLILKGVNIYPMQIESVLMGFEEVGKNYLIILERDGMKDTMRVQVELQPDKFVEDMRYLNRIRERIARALRDEILVTPQVELLQHNSLPASEGKAKRVLDLRKKLD